jgi:hypothetical protein
MLLSAVFRHAVVPHAGSSRFATLRFADLGRARHRAGPETVEARGARQKRVTFGTGKQGCMYHI